jgi:hypothetical protein
VIRGRGRDGKLRKGKSEREKGGEKREDGEEEEREEDMI